MNPEQVAQGLELFAENELLPAVEGWRLWIATAAVARFCQRSGATAAELTQYKIVSLLGIVDADGNIDVNAASEAMKEAIRKLGKMPVFIPVLDIEFNFAEKDVETLRGYIKQAAGVKS